MTYGLSPTLSTPLLVVLTNTARIEGSVLGPITRRAAVVQAYLLRLPLVMRG